MRALFDIMCRRSRRGVSSPSDRAGRRGTVRLPFSGNRSFTAHFPLKKRKEDKTNRISFQAAA
jgi:hypothetical protein